MTDKQKIISLDDLTEKIFDVCIGMNFESTEKEEGYEIAAKWIIELIKDNAEAIIAGCQKPPEPLRFRIDKWTKQGKLFCYCAWILNDTLPEVQLPEEMDPDVLKGKCQQLAEILGTTAIIVEDSDGTD